MAFCANCGTKMEDGVKFCPSCGTAAGAASSAAKPEREKAGNIVKCPNCGAPVPAMAAKCSECGHKFRNVGVAGTIKEFTDKLAEFNKRKAAAESKGNDDASDAIRREKEEFINNFPIPNTKEDLLEFFMLCFTEMKDNKTFSIDVQERLKGLPYDNWGKKCLLVYQKVETVLPDEKALLKRFADSLRSKGVIADTEERTAFLAKHDKKGTQKKIIILVGKIAAAAFVTFLFIKLLSAVGFFDAFMREFRSQMGR